MIKSFSYDDLRLPSGIIQSGSLSLAVSPQVNQLMNEVIDQLEGTINYNTIFSLVRKVVKKATGHERVGIGLALADLPSQLGAFWQVGGNFIIMNEVLLRALKAAKRPEREVNSFIFVILMHEYIHSIGYFEEIQARDLTSSICASLFNQDHPAFAIATTDPWQVYPFLMNIQTRGNSEMKVVHNFDTDSTSYII